MLTDFKPIDGIESSHSVKVNGNGSVKEMHGIQNGSTQGSKPGLTEQEIEEKLAETVTPPDGGNPSSAFPLLPLLNHN